jgi:outer membrane biosynthesis protein TonB
MIAEQAGKLLRLRVAMVWSQTLQAEQVLDEPRPVVLGYGDEAMFPLPEAHAARGDVTLLTPIEGGYSLHLPAGALGAVWLDGHKRDVRELLERSPSLTLGRRDYGVISLGAASYFFQQVETAPRVRRGFSSLDGDAVVSFGLSVFVHACLLVLMLLAEHELPFEASLEVTPELFTRFVVTPPPETVEQEPTKSKKEDAAPKKRDDGGGKRAPKDEGKFGRKDTQKVEHEIKGEPRDQIASKVRGMGLLGALAGGDTLKDALTDTNVGALLGGLGSARTDLGAGRGGKGLRGVGGGGGGAGPGSLMGGGALGTGLGAGGGGAGGGKGGSGRGGAGGGRAEAKVEVTAGVPQVSGYLSAEQINRVVRANQAALRYCYETEVQRQRGLRGKVVIQWRVDRAGAVPTARVASSTLHNAGVEGCIVRQVRKWHFPKPDGGEVAVMYPFIFGVGG